MYEIELRNRKLQTAKMITNCQFRRKSVQELIFARIQKNRRFVFQNIWHTLLNSRSREMLKEI